MTVLEREDRLAQAAEKAPSYGLLIQQFRDLIGRNTGTYDVVVPQDEVRVR